MRTSPAPQAALSELFFNDEYTVQFEQVISQMCSNKLPIVKGTILFPSFFLSSFPALPCSSELSRSLSERTQLDPVNWYYVNENGKLDICSFFDAARFTRLSSYEQRERQRDGFVLKEGYYAIVHVVELCTPKR